LPFFLSEFISDSQFLEFKQSSLPSGGFFYFWSKPIKATMSKSFDYRRFVQNREVHWRVFTSQGFVVYGTETQNGYEFYFSIVSL
jgi:hypothetical protein